MNHESDFTSAWAKIKLGDDDDGGGGGDEDERFRREKQGDVRWSLAVQIS